MSLSGSGRAQHCARRRRLVPVAFAIATELVAGSSPADTTGAAPGLENIDIRYVVHEGVVGCPTRDEFRAAVRRRLNANARRSEEPVVVTTEISRHEGGLQARVTMSSGAEQAPSAGHAGGRAPEAVQDLFGGKGECATVSAAVALTVALAIEHSIEEHAREPAPPPVPSGRERPEAPRSDEPRAGTPGAPVRDARHVEAHAGIAPPPSGKRAAPVALHVKTHVAAFAGYEIAPRWSAGTAFGVSLRYAEWSAGLETVFWPWTTVAATSAPDLAGRARLITARGAFCAHVDPLFACATGALGDYRVAGSRRVISKSDEVFWPAVGGRAGVELPIARPLSLALRADVQVPLVRASLELDGEPIWRPPPVGIELGLACQVALW
jgi:hypothetical protein